MPRKLPGWYLLLGVSLLAVLVRVFLSLGERGALRGFVRIENPIDLLLVAGVIYTICVALAILARNWIHRWMVPFLASIAGVLLAGVVLGFQGAQDMLGMALGAGLVSVPVAFGASWNSYVRWSGLFLSGGAAAYGGLRLRFNWAWEWPAISWAFVLIAAGMLVAAIVWHWKRGRRLGWSARRNLLNTVWLLLLTACGAWSGFFQDYYQRIQKLDLVAYHYYGGPKIWPPLPFSVQIDSITLDAEDDPELLKELRYFSPVAGITLHGSQITDEVLGYVPDWSGVQMLELVGTSITDAGLEKLPPLNAMTILSLRGNEFSARGLERLLDVPGLEALTIEDMPINGDAILERLQEQQAKAPSSLYLLELPETQVGDDFVEKLPDLPLINHINLSGTQVTGKVLPRLIKTKTLNFAVMHGIPLTLEDFSDLSLPVLRELPEAEDTIEKLSEEDLAREPAYGLKIQGGLILYLDPGSFTSEEVREIFQRTGIQIEMRESPW